jgi:hypothetical protein
MRLGQSSSQGLLGSKPERGLGLSGAGLALDGGFEAGTIFFFAMGLALDRAESSAFVCPG